ncbi:MAG: alpha/beta hydrolase [Gammaproteobacteria bacterium]|nr:alpha/beta hydrolase [Gammaproteobacteria bacterium]
MKWLRITGYTLLALALLAAVALGVALWIYRDIPAAKLEARYATEASRFIHIDGVRIHYRDEGSGPPILLLHANFSNLLGWDSFAEVLKKEHRVLRFDLPAFGLTGPDPSGDYSNARTVRLTERFADAMNLRRFSIAGTSLGGGIALRYAAKHPDRIDKLILLNPGLLEGRAMARAGTRLPDSANILKYITPRALAAYMLRSRAGDPGRITEEHVSRWHDLWLRAGNRGAILDRLRAYDSADVAEIVAQVRVPVLILWGEANPQTPLEQAAELQAMLTAAPEVRQITYPGVGHPALEEAGALIAQDVLTHLGGRLPAP